MERNQKDLKKQLQILSEYTTPPPPARWPTAEEFKKYREDHPFGSTIKQPHSIRLPWDPIRLKAAR